MLGTLQQGKMHWEDCNNKLAFHNYRCKLHLRTCMYPGCNVYASRVCEGLSCEIIRKMKS